MKEILFYRKFHMAIIRSTRICRGAIGGKTGNTAVLPEFWKIERSDSGGAGLIWFGRARHTVGGVPDLWRVDSGICSIFCLLNSKLHY